MSDDKTQRQRQRGEQAKRLLENELFNEAFEQTEKQIMEILKHTRPEDEAGVRNSHIALCLVPRIKQYIQQVVNDGKAADNKLLQMEKESKLKRVFNR
jgi:hypothetical protein